MCRIYTNYTITYAASMLFTYISILNQLTINCIINSNSYTEHTNSIKK